MVYKTAQYPLFQEYSRRDATWRRIETEGLTKIVAPIILETSSYNPLSLIEKVNEYTMCNRDGMELTPDLAKTMQARTDMINKSPYIMRKSKRKDLWVRSDNKRRLEYNPVSDKKIESEDPKAYIASIEAARMYVTQACICSRAALDRAIEEGRLNFFLTDKISHIQHPDLTLLDEIPFGRGKSEKRSNMKLFLLSEVNRL